MGLYGEIRLEIADGNSVRVSTGCVYKVSLEKADFENEDSEFLSDVTEHDIYVTEVCDGDANWFAGYSYQLGDTIIIAGRYTKSITVVPVRDSCLSYKGAALEMFAELTYALNKTGNERPLYERQRNFLLALNDTMDIICQNRLEYYPHEFSIFGEQVLKVRYGQLKKSFSETKYNYGFSFNIKCYVKPEDMPAKDELLKLPFVEKLEAAVINPFTNEGEFGVVTGGTQQAMNYFNFETEQWKEDIHFLTNCIQSINKNSSRTRAFPLETVMKYDCDEHQFFVDLTVMMECEGQSPYSEIRKYVEAIIKKLEDMALSSLCDSLERIIIRDESDLPF